MYKKADFEMTRCLNSNFDFDFRFVSNSQLPQAPELFFDTPFYSFDPVLYSIQALSLIQRGHSPPGRQLLITCAQPPARIIYHLYTSLLDV